MIQDSVDGLLLIQAWSDMTLHAAVRSAWQPLIDGATKSQDGRPLDPGGVSEWMAEEVNLGWPLPKRYWGAIPRE